MNSIIEAPEVPADIATIATEEGLKPFLDHALSVAKEAQKEVNDATTEKGRKAIGSLAMKVSKSKTAIAKPGAELVKALKQRGVDAQKLFKSYADQMDEITAGIKKPVTEYNEFEAARIEALHIKINLIGSMSARACVDTGTVYTSVELSEKRAIIAAMTFSELEFGDLHEQAMDTWSQALEFLDVAIKERGDHEQLIAENERLKAEQAEKDKQIEIERAATAATAKANQDSADEIARANLKVEQAEEDARKKLEQEQAAKDAEKKRIDDEAAAKAADIDHKKTINNTTMNELMQCCPGLTDKQAKLLISNFAHNKFSHISINY